MRIDDWINLICLWLFSHCITLYRMWKSILFSFLLQTVASLFADTTVFDAIKSHSETDFCLFVCSLYDVFAFYIVTTNLVWKCINVIFCLSKSLQWIFKRPLIINQEPISWNGVNPQRKRDRALNSIQVLA